MPIVVYNGIEVATCTLLITLLIINQYFNRAAVMTKLHSLKLCILVKKWYLIQIYLQNYVKKTSFLRMVSGHVNPVPVEATSWDQEPPAALVVWDLILCPFETATVSTALADRHQYVHQTHSN